MLRHEDIGDEPARLTVDCVVKTFRQEMSPLVVRQERNLPVTRERQLVAIPGFMRSLDQFPIAAHINRV